MTDASKYYSRGERKEEEDGLRCIVVCCISSILFSLFDLLSYSLSMLVLHFVRPDFLSGSLLTCLYRFSAHVQRVDIKKYE